ncbi:C40 family peptidase [Nocardia transvalensis]|uniref:C40 family peptidase n=1 Tax=Nocardia transvalensis TaxID=37333 RepID=UPI0018945983|nr:C40 family peptidase [Nocardia transvalensis]
MSALQSLAPGFDFRSLPPIPGLAWPEPAAPEKTQGERAVEAAESKLGAAYSYGSAGPDSFDCSGLVQWSYEQAGVDLPRTSYEQLDAGTPVSLDELEPGDLVSFYGGQHSALYAGDGKVIHAATSGSGVVMSPISEMPVSGARRF